MNDIEEYTEKSCEIKNLDTTSSYMLASIKTKHRTGLTRLLND